jgi:hypothetical protein
MRSRSYEEDVEGEMFESEDITLDTKHEDSISKSKNTLSGGYNGGDAKTTPRKTLHAFCK